MSVFEEILNGVRGSGYHNHRRETHSDLMSGRMIADLTALCPMFSRDYNSGAIKVWEKTKGPDDRTTDLLAGIANPDGTPNLSEVRLLVEHKSVITAHRNRNARVQDIDRERLSAHRANPRTIVVATVLVGTSGRVLNVPDCVAKLHRPTFPAILGRLSQGDQTLWDEFSVCVGYNSVDDPIKTINLFRSLPIRKASDTHLAALDFLLIAPVAIDNVNEPTLQTGYNGVDPISDYQRMIQHICRLYALRWHDGA